MSFEQSTFATIGAQSTDSPKMFSYQSTDTLAAVLTSGYFELKKFQLKENDWLFCSLSDANALLQITSDSSTAALSILSIASPAFAEYHLTTTPETIALNNDGVTYTPIPNMVLNIGREFTVDAGVMTYNGLACAFMANGTSDLQLNKAAEITYALVLNGVPVPSELTSVDIPATTKAQNISITAIAPLSPGDTVEIWAKGDGTTGIMLTVNKLDVTFLRVC